MKIIVLDYSDGTVNVLPMSKVAIDEYNMGEFDDASYVDAQGFKTSECNWMVCDEDTIPVYYGHESIPFTSI